MIITRIHTLGLMVKLICLITLLTLTNVAGCDSVVTLDLIINNNDNTSSNCDEFHLINEVKWSACVIPKLGMLIMIQ